MGIVGFLLTIINLGHDNIRRYCNRPFGSVEEMTETIIENHNKVVGPNDRFYHLGDFAFAGRNQAAWFLSRLNGKKYMIAGNHDKRVLFKRDSDFNMIVKERIIPHVEWIKDYYEMWVQDKELGKQFVVMHHYAPRVWNSSHKGAIYLYGHSHGTLPDDPNALSMDVGIDAIAMRYSKNGVLDPKDYRPISFGEVRKIMENKNVRNK